MRVSFPASAYCMVMKALWLVVALVKKPSLGVRVVAYLRSREREHSRRGDVWLVVGCLSESAGLDKPAFRTRSMMNLSERICCRWMVK